MSYTPIEAISVLASESPAVRQLLAEHRIANFGEVLPHPFMSELVAWMSSHCLTDRKVCEGIIRWMEYEYSNGAPEISDVIVLSGVQMIPLPGEDGAVLREWLRGPLRGEDPLVAVIANAPRLSRRALEMNRVGTGGAGPIRGVLRPSCLQATPWSERSLHMAAS